MKKRNLAIFLLISILFLFFIAACDKKTENKNSKVKKDAKTEKNITAESVIVAPETKNPITSAAIESQTANIDAKNDPATEEFVPDPPVTAADTSVQFVVGAPVVDKQVFDMTDSKVTEAFNAYYSMFTGQTDFCFFWGASQNTSVKNISQLADFISPRKLRRFAVIDLDNDNIPEVALSTGEYEDDFFIFKYYNDYIYVYERGIRSFNTVKIDGTFQWSSGGALSGTGSILFQGITTETEDKVYSSTSIHEKIYHINGKSVTYTECQKASEYQDNKPNATWYDFSDINLKIFKDMNN